MTKQDIHNKLGSLIRHENIIFFNRHIGIEVDKFHEIFGESELTFTSLIESGKATKENGWLEIFTDLRDRGILPN